MTQLAAARNQYGSDDSKEIEKIISLSGFKLCQNESYTTDALAIILARLPALLYQVEEEIGAKMVEKNMAIFHSISGDGREMSISYTSDPVLAAGAANVTRNTDRRRLL